MFGDFIVYRFVLWLCFALSSSRSTYEVKVDWKVILRSRSYAILLTPLT